MRFVIISDIALYKSSRASFFLLFIKRPANKDAPSHDHAHCSVYLFREKNEIKEKREVQICRVDLSSSNSLGSFSKINTLFWQINCTPSKAIIIIRSTYICVCLCHMLHLCVVYFIHNNHSCKIQIMEVQIIWDFGQFRNQAGLNPVSLSGEIVNFFSNSSVGFQISWIFFLICCLKLWLENTLSLFQFWVRGVKLLLLLESKWLSECYVLI